jgi:hypothetical protein
VNRRGVGIGLLVTGAVLVGAGVVGFALDDDSESSRAAPETTSTASSSSTASSTTTTAPRTAETPGEFFAAHAQAFRAGDVEFLYGRLHPATFDRYEATDCRAFLARADVPAYASEVLSVGGVAAWVWETDGLAREIDGVTTVRARLAEDGTNFVESDVHIVIGDDGQALWFTDCGTPKEGGR